MPRSRIVWIPLLLLGIAPAEAQEASKPPKRIEIRSFVPPALVGKIVGKFRYTSPLDSETRIVEIREVPNADWPFLGGRGEDDGRPSLKLGRAPSGVGYHGLAETTFDPCLADAARVDSLIAISDKLILELSVPYEGLQRTARCTGGLTFKLVGAAGERVRLKPTSELKVLSDSGLSVTYGADAPRIAADTTVTVENTTVDAAGARWSLVRAPGEPDDASPAVGWVRPEQVVTRIRYELLRVDGPPSE